METDLIFRTLITTGDAVPWLLLPITFGLAVGLILGLADLARHGVVNSPQPSGLSLLVGAVAGCFVTWLLLGGGCR